MGSDAAAERAYRAGLGGRLARDARTRTMLALAGLLKRSGRHDDAAEVWQALADEAPGQSTVALVELAKYWEHRRRDPVRACAIAEQAHSRWLAAQATGARRLPGLAAPPSAGT